MNDFWWLIILPIASLLGGAILVMVIYGGYSMIRDFMIKRKMPKDKKELSKYLNENREFFAYPKKEIYNEKEVEENERRKFSKFREFEKVRREVQRERDNRRPNGEIKNYGGIAGSETGGSLSLHNNTESKNIESPTGFYKSGIDLPSSENRSTNNKIKLHRPDDF